jgi:hypothetical protein
VANNPRLQLSGSRIRLTSRGVVNLLVTLLDLLFKLGQLVLQPMAFFRRFRFVFAQ